MYIEMRLAAPAIRSDIEQVYLRPVMCQLRNNMAAKLAGISTAPDITVLT